MRICVTQSEVPLSLEPVSLIQLFLGAFRLVLTSRCHPCRQLTRTDPYSATRGNIGLMCWAFGLFDIGFIITLLIRSILMWCSRPPLPKRPFASVLYWELVIHCALIMAFASTTVAIFLLNMTIWQLKYPQQEVLQLDLSPAPSALLSISVLAGAIFTVLVVASLIWWSNDFQVGKHHQIKRATADMFVQYGHFTLEQTPRKEPCVCIIQVTQKQTYICNAVLIQ